MIRLPWHDLSDGDIPRNLKVCRDRRRSRSPRRDVLPPWRVPKSDEARDSVMVGRKVRILQNIGDLYVGETRRINALSTRGWDPVTEDAQLFLEGGGYLWFQEQGRHWKFAPRSAESRESEIIGRQVYILQDIGVLHAGEIRRINALSTRGWDPLDEDAQMYLEGGGHLKFLKKEHHWRFLFVHDDDSEESCSDEKQLTAMGEQIMSERRYRPDYTEIWVSPSSGGRIITGNLSAAQNGTLLKALQVRFVVDCRARGEEYSLPEGIRSYWWPVGAWRYVVHNQKDRIQVQRWAKPALRMVRDHVEAGDTVFIHCLAGRHRAAAATVAALVYVNGWAVDYATSELMRCRPQCDPRVRRLDRLLSRLFPWALGE